MELYPELVKVATAASGAATSVVIIKGTPREKVTMFACAFPMAYFLAPPIAIYFNVETSTGAIGYVIGMLGMATAKKAYEFIEGINVKEFWDAVIEKIKR
jgi:hypothetical protein